MKSLPPLNLLEPFEASARLGSFTRAAEELSVTQSAVSQRVRKLEELMGIPLFERGHRAVSLTPQGRELLNGVTVALRHLASATHGLRQRDSRPSLKLAVDTSIAQMWLLPRLRPYLASTEACKIDLIVSDRQDEVLGADIAILHGDGWWPGYVARPLFADEIFPVCAPGFLNRRSIRTPADLLGIPLIDLDYVHWNWLNWGIWLTEAGLDPARAQIPLRTNSYVTQLDAARAGLGVALGWAHFVDKDLEQGTLVRPISEQIGTAYGYYLLLQEGADDTAQDLAALLFAARPETSGDIDMI